MRLIDADKLKAFYAWWEDDRQKLFDEIVDQQPTVELPVRNGKWVPKYIRIGGQDWVSGMKCSECGIDAINAGYDFLTDYCPNCGARMDEE